MAEESCRGRAYVLLVNRGTPVEGTKKVRILAGEREVIVCFVL